jgi:hypothetical protein
MNSGETVAIGWIDNGLVHGSFMLGLLEIVMKSQNTDNPVTNIFRSSGLNLGHNRDKVIDCWSKEQTDWLLWIDSDMSPTFDHFIKLKEKADKDTAPVVSGIYFVVERVNNSNLPSTRLCLGSDFSINLDNEELQPINWAGLGFILIHKDVIKKIKETFGEGVRIHQQDIPNNTVASDDMPFFEKIADCGIRPYVCTQVIVPHIKSIPIDLDYHLMVSKQEQ